MKIQMTPISNLKPAADNPRTTDPARLELVKLSLRKLGFLLPLYAKPDGSLLSGHQRVLAAKDIGASKVPVVTIDPADREQSVNILFNRATNDMAADATEAALGAQLDLQEIIKLAESLPDIQPDTPEFSPCCNLSQDSVTTLYKLNRPAIATGLRTAANMASTLASLGVTMPLVVSGKEVINGLGRLEHLARIKTDQAEVVRISREKADLARLLLNYLCMDFDFEDKCGDALRCNAFRRHIVPRRNLGVGFLFPILRSRRCKDFDLSQPQQADEWMQTFGNRILDFGSGHGSEAAMLRAAGVDVTDFEPYPAFRDKVDPGAGRASAKDFIDRVAEGLVFDSVFLSSVLNSVPFASDRAHIVTICAALCGKDTRLYAAARGSHDTGWIGINSGGHLNANGQSLRTFKLDHEEGTTLGDVSRNPKIQKYHTPKELYDLFKTRFATVQVGRCMNNVTAICEDPLPLDHAALKAALEFELNLPYPDGSRMGLADEAKTAFSKRLGAAL